MYGVLTCTVFVGVSLAVVNDKPPDVPPGLVAGVQCTYLYSFCWYRLGSSGL